LEHKDVRFRAQPAAQNRLSHQTNKDEAGANRLTASLLAPFDKANFKPGTTVDDVRNRFGLSHEAAKRRLVEFERIYRAKHGLRRPLPPGVIDFLVEQKRKGYRVTSLDAEAPVPRPQTQFDGDPCPSCGALKLVRNGLGRKCECCGARSGDD
jgi:hypothetical protein